MFTVGCSLLTKKKAHYQKKKKFYQKTGNLGRFLVKGQKFKKKARYQKKKKFYQKRLKNYSEQ